jgi:hypothetical protein
MSDRSRKHSTQPERDHKPATKTKTAQMFDDIIFWASLMAGFQRSTIAKVLDPLVRESLREMLREKGVNPDQAWADARKLEKDEDGT